MRGWGSAWGRSWKVSGMAERRAMEPGPGRRRMAAAILALFLPVSCGLQTAGLWGDDEDIDAVLAADGDVLRDGDGRDSATDGRDDGSGADGDADVGSDYVLPGCGNGTLDPAEECELGAWEACTTRCGTPGSHTCTDVCTWGGCSSSEPEVCNGADDDCDGATDEGPGWDCIAGAVEACGGCGLGTRACSGCVWGMCRLPDGACEPGAGRPCTPAVCVAGHETCGADCAWGECVPDGAECMPGDTRDTWDLYCGFGSEACTGACTWTSGDPAWVCRFGDVESCRGSGACPGYHGCAAGCRSWTSCICM